MSIIVVHVSYVYHDSAGRGTPKPHSKALSARVWDVGFVRRLLCYSLIVRGSSYKGLCSFKLALKSLVCQITMCMCARRWAIRGQVTEYVHAW